MQTTPVDYLVVYFPVGPHVLSHSTEEEHSPLKYGGNRSMITHDLACLRERKQTYERKPFFIIEIVLYTRVHQVSR